SATRQSGPFILQPPFSPDGKTLAGDSAGQVRLWDAQTGKERPVLDKEVSCLCFSPDGKILATGGKFGMIHLLDVSAPVPMARSWTPEGRYKDEVTSLLFSPDGKVLASLAGGFLRLWDVQNARETGPFIRRGELTELAFSPDGKTLVGGSSAGSIQW